MNTKLFIVLCTVWMLFCTETEIYGQSVSPGSAGSPMISAKGMPLNRLRWQDSYAAFEVAPTDVADANVSYDACNSYVKPGESGTPEGYSAWMGPTMEQMNLIIIFKEQLSSYAGTGFQPLSNNYYWVYSTALGEVTFAAFHVGTRASKFVTMDGTPQARMRCIRLVRTH